MHSWPSFSMRNVTLHIPILHSSLLSYPSYLSKTFKRQTRSEFQMLRNSWLLRYYLDIEAFLNREIAMCIWRNHNAGFIKSSVEKSREYLRKTSCSHLKSNLGNNPSSFVRCSLSIISNGWVGLATLPIIAKESRCSLFMIRK